MGLTSGTCRNCRHPSGETVSVVLTTLPPKQRLAAESELIYRAMAVVPSDDELRDLSVKDADELRAFLDKRRWFESRLTVSRGHRRWIHTADS